MKKELSLSRFHPSPEFLWIVSCLRLRWNPGDRSHLDLPSQKINWESLLSLLHKHGVLPLVYQNLKHMKANRPPDHIRDKIKAGYEWNAKRILKMTAALIQILNDFNEHSIKALPIKGPALAQSLYGNLHSRSMNDLDILIHPKDISQAEKILKKKGYTRIYPNEDCSSKKENLFKKNSHHFNYKNNPNKIEVELHWKLVRTPKRLPLTFDKMWEKKESVLLGGNKIPILSKDHTFLHLCEHGSVHAFYRLFWLGDVAEFIHQNPHENWENLFQQARRLNIYPHTLQAFYVSYKVFKASLPDPVSQEIQNNRQVRSLTRRSLFFIVQSKWFRFSALKKGYWLNKIYNCQREFNLKYKILFWLKSFFYNPLDWNRVQLPKWAFPLYFILRPIFWFQRRFSKEKQENILNQ